MTFFSKLSRSFSNTSDIFASHDCIADRGLLNGQMLFNAFAPQPSRSASPHSGTLTKAELQRIVADMVG